MFLCKYTNSAKFTIYNIVLNIITKLDAYLYSLNESFNSVLGIDLSNLEVIYHFETIDEIQSWLRRRLFEISETLHTKKMKSNVKLIDEIEQYVDARLGENFRLQDVAEYLSYSPNHLGKIFRDETGERFNDFVTRKRLEKAKNLLRGTMLKIYEVGDEVGYKHLTHFGRQFKETYGMTPSEFRNQATGMRT